MTFINWIGVGVMAALIITGTVLYVRFRRKVKDMDGFGGIMRGSEEAAYRVEPEEKQKAHIKK